MVSVHTSPLEQPGQGDAGGLNVYVDAVARRLARRGVEVEVFTRATGSGQAPRVEVEPGYAVRHVLAGPFGGVAKEDLPALLCPFAAQVLRAVTPLEVAGLRPRGTGRGGNVAGTSYLHSHGSGHGAHARFDVIHSHYWLSGLVGQLARERWGIPLVHTAHTLAKVKNAALAGDDDRREPRSRELGEETVAAEADVLVAPTFAEAMQLSSLYGADPSRIAVVPPGVDVELFRSISGGPADGTISGAVDGTHGLRAPIINGARGAHPVVRAALRDRWQLGGYDTVLAFVGRIQPHKGPEVLVRALAELRRRHPERRIGAMIVGNSSGTGHREPERLAALAANLGVADDLRLLPALPPTDVADVYRAADVVAVPSHSESFGLVALEAQACGTPVVAASVGGLPVAVRDGVTGLLVEGHGTAEWADALESIALNPARRDRMARAARAHAEEFSWSVTVDRLLQVYERAAAPSLVGLEAGA